MRHVASGRSIEVSPTCDHRSDVLAKVGRGAYLGQENSVHFGAMLEPFQNAHALGLASPAVDVKFTELLRVRLFVVDV